MLDWLPDLVNNDDDDDGLYLCIDMNDGQTDVYLKHGDAIVKVRDKHLVSNSLDTDVVVNENEEKYNIIIRLFLRENSCVILRENNRFSLRSG